MKILYFITLVLINSEKIIRNINIPSCRNCIHYLPENYNKDFSSSFNKCNKFGEKDIITNEIRYDFVSNCRKDENKCGEDGKYFEYENNINLKIIKHQFFSNAPYYTLWISIILNYVALIYSLQKK